MASTRTILKQPESGCLRNTITTRACSSPRRVINDSSSKSIRDHVRSLRLLGRPEITHKERPAANITMNNKTNQKTRKIWKRVMAYCDKVERGIQERVILSQTAIRSESRDQKAVRAAITHIQV